MQNGSGTSSKVCALAGARVVAEASGLCHPGATQGVPGTGGQSKQGTVVWSTACDQCHEEDAYQAWWKESRESGGFAKGYRSSVFVLA